MGTETERACACGKAIRGKGTRCHACQYVDRVCPCGVAFRGVHKKCSTCRVPERTCGCGKTYRGTNKLCSTCRASTRTCACGQVFRGKGRLCSVCGATDRQCTICGRDFHGSAAACSTCQKVDRVCRCGREFRGTNLQCRQCVWLALPEDLRAAMRRSHRHARRARERGAQVSGPVPSTVYAAIRASGPCVYCGDPATTVDHVVPLSRGGREHEDNLVPSCNPCNLAKYNRLLREWDAERVAHGIRASDKVAAAW